MLRAVEQGAVRSVIVHARSARLRYYSDSSVAAIIAHVATRELSNTVCAVLAY
jgi:tRNA-dihydrouridine synthase